MIGLLLALWLPGVVDEKPARLTIQVPMNEAAEVEIGEVVSRLAVAFSLDVPAPAGPLRLTASGRSGPVTRTLLVDTLGPDATIDVRGRDLVISIDPGALGPTRRADWERRLRDLSSRATREIERRRRYGMGARPSYRPNDPARPTVCLIHGLNSSSGVFVHMVGPIEAAGFGVVVYDFPYNRDLDQTSEAFRRDWLDFRRRQGEARPWSIVAHSMGSLLARSYVEGEAGDGGDVASLILIAPPNHGSSLSQAQTLLQTDPGRPGPQRRAAGRPPGSAGRRPWGGGGRHDAGERLPPATQRPAPAGRGPLPDPRGRFGLPVGPGQAPAGSPACGSPGWLGGSAGPSPAGSRRPLDEITDGLGDGCVSVASTRLDGVADHRTIHANHLELIRAPLLFPDPGPVASMPAILEWLGEARADQPPKR